MIVQPLNVQHTDVDYPYLDLLGPQLHYTHVVSLDYSPAYGFTHFDVSFLRYYTDSQTKDNIVYYTVCLQQIYFNLEDIVLSSSSGANPG